VRAAVVAVIDVLLTTVTPVAAVPPKLTVAPAKKFVPAIVTVVPPPAGPVLGATDVTVGAGLLEV
jgi:hypothetical protein